MKRISLSALAVFALAIAGCSTAGDHYGALATYGDIHAYRSSVGCSGTVFGNADLCYDASNGYAVYYNNGGAWSILNNGTSSFSTLTVSGAATFGSIPAAGAIGGTTPAAGTFTTDTITSTADEALLLSNGGHITSLLGTSTLPTVGTGTVTAGGTDSAMQVTGATSPATVTFNTAFHAKPICVCSNEGTAADGCKAVANSNGQTVVVTTASTDTFDLVCVGK